MEQLAKGFVLISIIAPFIILLVNTLRGNTIEGMIGENPNPLAFIFLWLYPSAVLALTAVASVMAIIYNIGSNL